MGDYIGVSAASLEEFKEKISEVPTESLEFHINRNDFEKWVAGTLKDRELAKEIMRLRDQNLTGEDLRDQLHLIVSKRCKELKTRTL